MPAPHPGARLLVLALLVFFAVFALAPATATAGAAPAASAGPVGWGPLSRLDLLPMLDQGVSARQFSSFDRSGGNEDDTFPCLGSSGGANEAEGGGECVHAEHSGPGEITSIWFTRDYGDVSKLGNLRVELDGQVAIDAPLQSVVNGGLGAPFTYPLVANADQSSGGVYIKVPLPFRNSMKVSTNGDPRWYHVAFRTFSNPGRVRGLDAAGAAAARSVLARAGSRDPKPRAAGARQVVKRFRLAAGQRLSLADIAGAGTITGLRLRFARLTGQRSGQPAPRTALLRDARLQMSFDGRRTVDSPLGEFFGSGLQPAAVRSLMFAQLPSGSLRSWWPMPFRREAQVALANRSKTGILSGELLVSHAPNPSVASALAAGRAGYFRASSRAGQTVPGQPWLVLDARGRGKLVGVNQTMQGRSNDYLEGDEQVYIDGSSAPQIHGTGTEDFYEGGFYFRRGTFTGPFTGNPVRAVGVPGVCPSPDCTTAYRVLVSDAIPFNSGLRFVIEHGPANDEPGLYGSTAFWYGR